MARARNIKPGFFTNEELVELPFATRLLFAGLWTLADREGRMEDRPKKIKMALFPADDVNVDAALADLQAKGFILRYEIEGERYIAILEFKKHQNPHHKEAASTIPAPTETTLETVKPEASPGQTAEVPVSTVLVTDSLIPDSLIPDSLQKHVELRSPVAVAPDVVDEPEVEIAVPAKPERRKQHRASQDVQDVFAYWQLVMGHAQAKLDDKRSRAIGARLADGYTVADLCQAVDGCKQSPHHMGQNDTHTVYDDIELICRNGPKVDGFIKRAKQAPLSAVPTGTTNQQKTMAAVQRYLEKHGHVA